MQVILLQRIGRLGQMGDIVNVKDGYARNYLLPQKKALRATEDNKKVFDGRRAQLEADNLAHKAEAEAVSAKLEGKSFVLIRAAGDTGQLYGSVSTRDIATVITEGGFTVDRNQIILDKPIKALGLTPRQGSAAPRSRQHRRPQHRPFAGRSRQAGARRKRCGRQGRSARARNLQSRRRLRGRCRCPLGRANRPDRSAPVGTGMLGRGPIPTAKHFPSGHVDNGEALRVV